MCILKVEHAWVCPILSTYVLNQQDKIGRNVTLNFQLRILKTKNIRYH